MILEPFIIGHKQPVFYKNAWHTVDASKHTELVTVYQWFPLSQPSPDNWLTAVNEADVSWLWGSVTVPGGRRCHLSGTQWDVGWGGVDRQALPWSTGFSSAPPWRDRLDRGQGRWRNTERQKGGEGVRPSELTPCPNTTQVTSLLDAWIYCTAH